MGKAQATTENAGVVFKSTKPKSSIKYINPKKLLEEGALGVVVQGRYLGRADKNNFDKCDFKVESMNEKGEDGSPVLFIINESGNLASRMANIAVGDLVQVRYLGQEKISQSKNPKLIGKSVHQWAVDTAE